MQATSASRNKLRLAYSLHQHPRCFHCVPCQQLTEDNPHTPPPPPTHIEGQFRCDSRTWRHSPGACSGVCPSVYPHVSSVPRRGGPHTHTHTHYHAVSEKNSSLLPCNVTIFRTRTRSTKIIIPI